MATLSVWRFDTAAGAEGAVATLQDLQKQEPIQLHDAATVTWEPRKKKPKTRHLADLTGEGALGGAFWGFLFGLIFFVPLLGMAVGAAAGALGGSLANVGIDKDFIERVREEIRTGQIGAVRAHLRRGRRPRPRRLPGHGGAADPDQPVGRGRAGAAHSFAPEARRARRRAPSSAPGVTVFV